MKKIFLTLIAILIICPASYANSEDNIALLTKTGFFKRPSQRSFLSPSEKIKKTLRAHLNYANTYNLEGLKSLYAPNFINADGLNKEIYFKLIKKTWESYPDIKYKISIKNITISEDTAVAVVSEKATASTVAKSGVIKEKGLLESYSDSIYYLKKSGNDWLVTSDHITFEKTSLKYGSAKDMDISITAPSQMLANTQYTSTLKMDPPKNSLVIASIGQENITYPQTVAKEVFRKLPKDGILERVFKSNDKNINEYAVASFGITTAEVKNKTEIKIYVTGLGFVMSRVNVIPTNKFVKIEEQDDTEETEGIEKAEVSAEEITAKKGEANEKIK